MSAGNGSIGSSPPCRARLTTTSIYLLGLQWEGDHVSPPAIPAKNLSSRLLTKGVVKVVTAAKELKVSVAAADQWPLEAVVVWELDVPAGQIPPLAVSAQSPPDAQPWQ